MNTDDYEGHTPGPWKWAEHTGGNQLWGVSIVIDDGWTDCLNCGSTKNSLWDYTSPADMELIAAAPDLLAEVKRLHEVLVTLKGTIDGYIRDEWDGNLEGWQCASDNIAALGIKSEWEEEE